MPRPGSSTSQDKQEACGSRHGFGPRGTARLEMARQASASIVVVIGASNVNSIPGRADLLRIAGETEEAGTAEQNVGRRRRPRAAARAVPVPEAESGDDVGDPAPPRRRARRSR